MPLPNGKSIMCAYKLCKVEFRYWGMQTKLEKFIHDVGMYSLGYNFPSDVTANVFVLLFFLKENIYNILLIESVVLPCTRNKFRCYQNLKSLNLALTKMKWSNFTK